MQALRCQRSLGILSWELEHKLGVRRSAFMDPLGERALEEVNLAEAELAQLKHEQLLRDLLTTEEPTAEATARLQKLREDVARLTAKRPAESDEQQR
jgi:hypothetical protein